MSPDQFGRHLVETAARARISAQNDRPLTDAEWSAMRSRIEEKWMAAALAAVIPDILNQLADTIEDSTSRDFPGRGWDFQYAAAIRRYAARDNEQDTNP